MNKDNCDKASRKKTIITALRITGPALLMLVSVAGAAQSTNVWFHKGSELMSSEKYNGAIKTYDKAIEINPHDSSVWRTKGLSFTIPEINSNFLVYYNAFFNKNYLFSS
jgi:hypothetical protein